ncbi:MAG: hypothetical protein H6639_10150 [Caldilineaceae bacterium]|nr:hypothetical protein [Caldilineaceae bacterium]
MLERYPLVGPIPFDHDVLVYLAYLMVLVSIFLLNRTTWAGRFVGRSESRGIDLLGVRQCGALWHGDSAASWPGWLEPAEHRAAQHLPVENMTNGIGHCGGAGLFLAVAARWAATVRCLLSTAAPV